MSDLRARARTFAFCPVSVSGRWAGTLEEGNRFAVAEVVAYESFDFARAAKVVQETLESVKETIGHLSLEDLRRVVISARDRVRLLAKEGSHLEFDLALAYFQEGVFYLVATGRISPYILRGTRTIYLKEEGDLWSKSFLPEPGDRLVILSSSLAQVLSPALFRSEIPWESPDGKRRAEVAGAAGLALDFFEIPSPEKVSPVAVIKTQALRLLKKLSLRRERPIYVRATPKPQLRESHPRIPVLLLLLGAIFVGSVIFTLVKERHRVRSREAAYLLDKAEEEVQSARDLLGLDSDRVVESLTQAREDLAKAEVLGLSNQRAQSLKKEVEDLEAKVSKVFAISSTLFYDMRIQGRSVSASDLALTDGELFVSDRGQGAIFKIAVPTGSEHPQVARFAENLAAPVKLDTDGDTLVVRDGSGISAFSLDGTLLGKISLSVGEISDLKAYGGKIYLLVPSKKQIFKAPAVGGELKPWFKEAVEVGEGSKMALDGYIYLWSNGTLHRLARGRETDFTLRLDLLRTPIQTPRVIITWRGAKNIYILDGKSPRVLKFSKDGALRGQYTDSKWEKARALAISSDEKYGYVLVGNKIWRFSFGSD